MQISAIHHDMDKRYCFALERGKFLIRLQVQKGDMKKVTLHIRDKNISIDRLDTRQTIPMVKVAGDRCHDYYEAIVNMDVLCLRYFFELEDTAGQVLYYGNYEFSEEIFEDIYDMFDCPQNMREEEMFLIPEWAANKVVYQIFPSRFATDKEVAKKKWYKAPISFKDELGGNLRGIINHLDHLKDLGIDVIYMTPVFQSDSVHKYDTIDYYRIDPSFGTEDDLRELVDTAHEMGMRVILDAVFNHTSPKFFAFADLKKKEKQSAYRDWYFVDSFPLHAAWGEKPSFKSFAYFGGMPKLNLKNQETQDYFIKVGLYWLEKCHIEGWRLDVADEISHVFWKRFRDEIKAVNPQALIIGEVWHYAADFLEGDEWDTVMNYPFYQGVRDLVADEKIKASRFLEKLGFLRGNLHNKVYPVLWNLIDSHDTPRFLNVCGEQKDKQKLGAALQLLLPGMPMIYYGDEYGLTGGQDPDCRRGMLWDEEYQDRDMYRWYQTLIRIRKEHPCLTEGTTVSECADDETGLITITKTLNGEKITVLFHAGAQKMEVVGYDNCINLVTGEEFYGKVMPWEALVLSRKV